jgi:dihydroflavonol-4-reductase
MDALVTGGCGFIGRHVVQALLARGQSVRVLDISPPDVFHENEHIRGSILDPQAVKTAMTGVRRVFHVAGIAHLWVPRREDYDHVNGRGTEIVLRAAAQEGVERVIHCSTEAVLLPAGRPSGGSIDGTTLPPEGDMPGPYTRSKHRAERAALATARQGLDIVVVNPTLPIGPDDRNMTPPAAMLLHFLKGNTPFFLDCVLNFVDVREVAKGMVLASDFGRAGARYILGGQNIPLRDVLAVIGRESGCTMPKFAVPAAIALNMAKLIEWNADHLTGKRPAATREGVRLALRSAPFDTKMAEQDLGYSARPADRAIRETVRWLVINGSVSSPAPLTNVNVQRARW